MGVVTDFLENHPETSQWLVIASLCFLLYKYVIYPMYFHPLAQVPGPKLGCISKYYIIYKTLQDERNCLVQQLHEKYGPIVRLGPDEVDISDISYQKEIYMNNFDKSQFYGQFGIFGESNTFSSLTKKPHQQSRKLSNKFYSKSTVSSPPIQEMVKTFVDKTLDLFDSMSLTKGNAPVNVYDIFQMMAMDVSAGFSFGTKTYRSLLDDPTGYGHEVIEKFRLRSSYGVWTTLLPRWKKYVTPEFVKQAGQYGNDWIFNNTMDSLDKGSDLEARLASVLLHGGKSKVQVAAEIGDHVAAGYQTTGTTLSYCIWRISENKEVQLKLQQELQFLQGRTSFSYLEVDELPYLNAVLDETYRLHAAIPGQEPRLVPSSGLKWHGCKQTPLLVIPAGTIVNMQPWTLHRDPAVFSNPEHWDPQRWLELDEDKLRTMHKQLMTFGAGIRMCLGMNLAVEEMKLVVAGIYSRFSTHLDAGFDYQHNMHMEDLYTTHPRGRRCDIKFERLV